MAISTRAIAEPATPEDLARLRGRGAPAEVLISTACSLSVAAVREVLGVELHKVQLMAGAALCAGWAVQMRTGEGKTFAAIPAAALHASITGPVHVATANSYLAERDSGWSGAVLSALGVTVGASLPRQSRGEKRAAYSAGVVFAAGVDLGFDYLRDQLHLPGDDPVMRGRHVVIVDEADAVLLDNARTPLVLSGAMPSRAGELQKVERVVRALRIGTDVELDREHRRIELTDAGVERCEELLGVENLYTPDTVDWPTFVHNALRARALLARDRDYVVVDGRVEVIDALTGRIIEGRRWSEGLHQAVEAKEGVPISPERRPVAVITQGRYFGGYDFLCGMSGTLEGAEEELATVYGVRTVAIPTHRPVIRVDHPGLMLGAASEKLAAVADDVSRRHKNAQPVLIGTTSIASTRAFSSLLRERGIEHETLTAEEHEREAAIIAEAGRPGAVTVATQMAGRGVDIVLGGGEPELRRAALSAGGLMVWGLEHHPTRRLDGQLRGRAGRQGDPGESRFAACPEDELAAYAPDGLVDAESVLNSQQRAELAEEQLRAEVRFYDTAVDLLHDHLYRWRERSRDRDQLSSLLSEAVNDAGVWVARGGELPNVEVSTLPRWGRRRGATAEERLSRRLAVRSKESGSRVFEDASELILRTLLVLLWPAVLEELEGRKAFARAVPTVSASVRDWEATVVDAYRRFERETRTEWIRQLLAFRVVRSSEPPCAPALPADMSLPMSNDGDGTVVDGAEQALLHEWQGWSFNRFVREHFGPPREDPPVVLVVDAIGEEPEAHGLTLDLNLEEPARTVIYVRE